MDSAAVRCDRAKLSTMHLHPQQGLLQRADALQKSEASARNWQRRVVLATLLQLGIR